MACAGRDGVDVLVLTALFSWAYRWLKHPIAVQVAFGLLPLLAVSWIASHLGLILTSYLLLSAVSAIAAIVVVVVFQHEIRPVPVVRAHPRCCLPLSTHKGDDSDRQSFQQILRSRQCDRWQIATD